MSVAVAGATGGVGKAVVERLAREGVPTRALVRDQYKAVSGSLEQPCSDNMSKYSNMQAQHEACMEQTVLEP